MNVLIFGVNGFIGSALVDRILAETEGSVAGIDLQRTSSRTIRR